MAATAHLYRNAHDPVRDATLVKASELEIYLALGWRLVEIDRPVIAPPKCFQPKGSAGGEEAAAE